MSGLVILKLLVVELFLMLTDYKPLLKNKYFLILWSSQLLSQITIHMVNFLFLIRIFEKTGSSIATSVLWVVYALPAILIGPFAAASVDMTDKRKLLVLSNLLQALTILMYSFIHETSLFLLYGVAFTYAFLNQFYVPSEQSALPDVVTDDDLAYANSLFFLTQQGAMIIGLALVGPLSHIIGFRVTLQVAAVLLFFAFISVTFLPKLKVKDVKRLKMDKLFTNFFDKMSEGYRAVLDDKLVLAPFLLLLCLQVVVTVVAVNAPVITQDLFGIPLSLAGIILIVPTGIGAVIGALYIPRKIKQGTRKIKLIKISLFFLVAGFFLLIFLLPDLNLLQRIVLGVFTLILMGISFVGIFIPSQTFLQEKTPEGYRGRVFGNYWFIVTIATVIPVLLSGTITEIFGIRTLLFVISIGLTILFVYLRNNGELFLVKNHQNNH